MPTTIGKTLDAKTNGKTLDAINYWKDAKLHIPRTTMPSTGEKLDPSHFVHSPDRLGAAARDSGCASKAAHA